MVAIKRLQIIVDDIWIRSSEDELQENLGAKVFDFLGGKSCFIR